MHPKWFRLITYADGCVVICRASSTATLGNHLRVAHHIYLAINAHDVRYRESLVGEVVENVFDSILKPICADALLGYALGQQIEKFITHAWECYR